MYRNKDIKIKNNKPSSQFLRVITGTAKGKKLIAPYSGTRPLTDRIKTNIFDLIREFIQDANVLDLYAGSGSFGIEALSRGANYATFVDLGSESISCIETNLINTDLIEKAEIIQSKVNDYIIKVDQKFDLIFLDPPFPDTKDADLAALQKIVSDDGLIIYRSMQNTQIDLSKTNLEAAYTKILGKSKLNILRKITHLT